MTIGPTMAGLTRYLGYPAEAWLATQWCRQAAKRAEDPVLQGLAAWVRVFAAGGCGAYVRGHSLATRAVDELQRRLSLPHAPETLGLLLSAGHTCYATKRASDGAEYFTAEYFTEATRLAARTGETATFDQYFGPTNVNFWKINAEADGGDPGRAVAISRETNPTVLPIGHRQVAFYLHSGRALARTRRDREAIRYLLTAERIAPQHVRSSPLAAETARGLLEHARRQAGGSELRGLCERLRVAT